MENGKYSTFLLGIFFGRIQLGVFSLQKASEVNNVRAWLGKAQYAKNDKCVQQPIANRGSIIHSLC